MKKREIYLDYAATTPLDPKVFSVMKPFWMEEFGNPSSIYERGERAKQAIENARLQIANVLSARPSEIIFTAGGTESANLALFGVVNASKQKKKHIISVVTEHDAVLAPLKALQKKGVEVTLLPVDTQGKVDLKQLEKSIKPHTILVSLMYANNEIGIIHPISEVASILRKVNAKRKEHILLHTDACQAAGYLSLNVNKLGVDLMTLNASKIYGPKQVGCLYVRTGVKIEPLIYGGGQERNFRSGTENTPGIVGFGKALEMSEQMREQEVVRLSKLQEYFVKRLFKVLSKISLNGPNPFAKKHPKARVEPVRLVNNVNVCIPQVEGETLLLYLDFNGIIVSTGSACSSTSTDPSHVLLALGRSESEARSSVRFTMGRHTTKQDLGTVLKVLPKLVKELSKFKKLY